MIFQFIKAKVDVMSPASPTSAMVNLAPTMTIASAAAVAISSLSPSEDACLSRKMSSVLDSSNLPIDLPFPHSCHPLRRPLPTCTTSRTESTRLSSSETITPFTLTMACVVHMVPHTFAMDSDASTVQVANLAAVDNSEPRKTITASRQ